MKVFSTLLAITLTQWTLVAAAPEQQQMLRKGDNNTNDTSTNQHPEPPIARDLSQANDDQCKEVYRRPLFGVTGDTTKIVNKNGGWIELTKQYGPFGYGSPDPQPNTLRKWRLYAVYWDENSSGRTNVQIKIANGDDAVFTMPRIAGGWGWKAAHFSDYYQKGSGSAEEINKSHAIISARLDSTAPYNNHGAIHAVDLIAYDCPKPPQKVCSDFEGPHKTCSGTSESVVNVEFERKGNCASSSSSWRDCHNDDNRASCLAACSKVDAGAGCCSYRAHLASSKNGVDATTGKYGCLFYPGAGQTPVYNGNADIFASICKIE